MTVTGLLPVTGLLSVTGLLPVTGLLSLSLAGLRLTVALGLARIRGRTIVTIAMSTGWVHPFDLYTGACLRSSGSARGSRARILQGCRISVTACSSSAARGA